jgi:hypothetical protein
MAIKKMKIQFRLLTLIVFCLSVNFFMLLNTIAITRLVPEDGRWNHYNKAIRSAIGRKENEIWLCEFDGRFEESINLKKTIEILKESESKLLTFGWPISYRRRLLVGNFWLRTDQGNWGEIVDNAAPLYDTDDVYFLEISINAVVGVFLSIFVATSVRRIVDWIRSKKAIVAGSL